MAKNSKHRLRPVASQCAKLIRFNQSRIAQAVSLALVTATVAQGQTVEEIVVTATKRSESLQDVPLAITALTGDFTRNVNLDDVKDLISFTPGVTGNSKDSFLDAISIRGVRTQDFGNGGDPSIGIFKNNFYEGRNGSAVTSLYDVERSEVLRGPQGFLFGRNAIGGAISVHTAKAVIGEKNGYVELDFGERDRVVFEGAYNMPVNDNFAMRFAGYYLTEDGYVGNTQAAPALIAPDKFSLRWSTTYETDKLKVTTFAEFEDRDQTGSVYRAIEDERLVAIEESVGIDYVVPDNARDVSADFAGGVDQGEVLSLGITFEYDLGWATFESATGFKDHDYFYSEDYDGTNLNLVNYQQQQSGQYLQQEFRLISQNDSPLSWYAGVSYYREDLESRFRNFGSEENFCAYYYGGTCEEYVSFYQDMFDIPDFVPSSNGLLDETSRTVGDFQGWAAYVDLEYQFTDALDVSLGVRYTFDEKQFSTTVFPVESDIGPYFLWGFITDGALTETEDWDDVTPRGVVRYQPTDDSLYFFSITKGFKSGGFGTFAVRNINDPDEDLFQFFGDGIDEPFTQEGGYRPATFLPETVWSYEIGHKRTFWDDRVNLSASAFYFDYEDLQVNFFDQGARVGNTREAEGRGAEFTINAALGEYFSVYLAGSYLDTEAFGLDFVCAEPGACEGSPLFWAPEFSGALTISGNFPTANGEWTGNIEAFGESSRGRGYDDIAASEIDPFIEMAFRFGYRSNSGWSAVAYVENAFNELTFDGSENNSDITPAFFFGPSRQRTVGLRFSYDWE